MTSPRDPFRDDADDEAAVVAAAQAGDRDALTKLVTDHRPWIYNLALRMVWNPATAEELTQDILVKVMLRLASFEGRSRFRTWLYRVAVNTILTARAGPVEDSISTFEDYGRGLDTAPDADPPQLPGPERDLLVEEAKVGCMTGMLLCLSREQRVAYILGSVFGVEDTVAAELLEISREAFRKRLSRARADLHNFMQNKCGLVNTDNPCRCARKTRAFIDRGFVDPENLKFVQGHAHRVRDVARAGAPDLFAAATEAYPRLFREHPFADPARILDGLRQALEDTPLRGSLD